MAKIQLIIVFFILLQTSLGSSYPKVVSVSISADNPSAGSHGSVEGGTTLHIRGSAFSALAKETNSVRVGSLDV
jgi:hypothetical protein